MKNQPEHPNAKVSSIENPMQTTPEASGHMTLECNTCGAINDGKNTKGLCDDEKRLEPSDKQHNQENNSSIQFRKGYYAIYQQSGPREPKSLKNIHGENLSNSGFVAIKNGFCWPALFFSTFWAFFSGMFGIGCGLLFLSIFLKIFGAIATDNRQGLAFFLLVDIPFLIWIGLFGNDWRKSSLVKKGYKLVQANTPGSSPSEAIKFYTNTIRNSQKPY